MGKELYLIVHNIRSAYNVGSIFRTADGSGVTKIYLAGYTPAPYSPENDVYPTKAQKMLSKTALGAEKNVPWEEVEDVEILLAELKRKKVEVVALEKTDGSIDSNEYEPRFPCALILGNEVEGIEGKILEKADRIISIPMRGKKESLNVAVAAGIAMYKILG